MKQIWKTALPFLSVYDVTGAFRGALVKEGECLKYYLFYGNTAGMSAITLDIKSGEQIDCDESVSNTIKNKELYPIRKPPKHYSEDDFVFDEYRIAHKGEWGYGCTKNGDVLWKKSLKGYLYTDIIKVGDRIILGTAGQGGHFYSLDINTGELVFDFNTKGTCAFLQANDSFYFSVIKKKSTDIYRIDYDGNVLETLEIEGIANDYDFPLTLWDQSIYVISVLEKKKEGRPILTPVVNRIDL